MVRDREDQEQRRDTGDARRADQRETLAGKVLSQGVGGLIVNMPFSGHVPGTVTAIGPELAPLLST